VDALAVTHLDIPPRCRALRICRAYAVGDETTSRIVPGVRGDLAYQEKLTALMGGARPARLDRPACWPDAIAELLGAPVLIKSYGPASTDKRVLPHRLTPPRLTPPAAAPPAR
jgi:adenylosuccinate synthase